MADNLPDTQTSSDVPLVSYQKAANIVNEVDRILKTEHSEDVPKILVRCMHAKTWKATGGKGRKQVDDNDIILAAIGKYISLLAAAGKITKSIPSGHYTQNNYYGPAAKLGPAPGHDGGAGAPEAGRPGEEDQPDS